MPRDNRGTGFTRKLERDEPRLLIRSTCARCGASRLVSEADQSLEDWEEEHRCPANCETEENPACDKAVRRGTI